MYSRHQQVMMPREVAAAYAKCGECRYFSLKPKDTFVHPGFWTWHYRCGLFNSEVRAAKGWADFGDGSTDWYPNWLACGAFWPREGEVER
jgi:hypothetical protein